MKGDSKILAALDGLLALELSAIDQYMVHAEMVDNWGYSPLHEYIEKRAITEMKHASKLISRILFLEGMPTVTVPVRVAIGSDVPTQFRNDLQAEMEGIGKYREAIGLAISVGDAATRQLLEEILHEEDEHVNVIEANQDQIGQMGLSAYLSTKVGT